MNKQLLLYRLKLKTRGIRIILLMLSILLLLVSTTLAHGPKGHGDMEFTALQAAKKGIELYDRLVESRKLKESWETDLANIEVFSRQSAEKIEYVVKFSRSQGEPQSVYIFLSEKGDYIGSNFTGN